MAVWMTYVPLLTKLMPVAEKIKSWLFPDNKFDWKRTLMLLIFGLMVGVPIAMGWLSPEQMDYIMKQLESFADVIGQAPT